jgi:hypothetical protein
MRTRPPKRLHRLLLLAVFFVLLLAACSGDSSDSATSNTDTEQGGSLADRDFAAEDSASPAAEPSDDAAGGANGIPTGLQPTNTGRDLIFTADIELVVDDVDAAADASLQAIEAVGGLLYGQRTSSEPVARIVLTFRVSPADFSEALARLSSIGEVRNQRVTTDDVTDRLVDLDSQIASLEISVERLRGFLEDATSVSTIATLESELLDRETRLELLRAQRRTIQNQVDLSTITLTIEQRVYSPNLSVPQTAYEGHDLGSGCPGLPDAELDRPGPLTVCYLVQNTGDRELTGVTVIDESLRTTEGDVIVVNGNTTLAPDETVMLAIQFDLDESARLQGSARATAADYGSVSVRGEPMWVTVQPDDSLPGFGESIDNGVDVLQWGWSVLVIAAGFAIPLLWIPLLALAIVWLWRRRSQRDSLLGNQNDGGPDGVTGEQ